MEFTRYEQDPINGRFYKVTEQGFTDAEWDAFCERWQPTKKSLKSKIKTLKNDLLKPVKMTFADYLGFSMMFICLFFQIICIFLTMAD